MYSKQSRGVLAYLSDIPGQAMVESEARKRAAKKYAQTKKGQAALRRAHQKRADTEDYRAYQRQKQAEYRRKNRNQTASSHTSPAKPVQAQESPLTQLDKLIERFEVNLHKQMSQQGLTYETLPTTYQRVLDALQTWKAEPREN